MAQPAPTKALFLQPPKTVTMCRQPEGDTYLLPPIPPLLLVTHPLFSKMGCAN